MTKKPENKIEFGLEKVHVAKITSEDALGNLTTTLHKPCLVPLS